MITDIDKLLVRAMLTIRIQEVHANLHFKPGLDKLMGLRKEIEGGRKLISH